MRRISLDPATVDVLTEHRRRYHDLTSRLQIEPDDNVYLFSRRPTRPTNPLSGSIDRLLPPVSELVSTLRCGIVTPMGQVVSMLARPVYRYAEVDRLLRLTPGTAKRWIDGYERSGRTYDPVVRQERTDSPWVTWGEFVEARLLSEFRSSVPMIKLRPVVEWLRARVDRDYPLAYARPFLAPEGKDLLVAAQLETGLDEELWMVVPSQQGVLLTPTSTRFTEATHYPDHEGPAEHIIADPATPAVWLHPMRREGQPTVNGIRTETLAELVAAGEPMQFVADTYGFTLAEVEQAVAYETTRRRAA